MLEVAAAMMTAGVLDWVAIGPTANAAGVMPKPANPSMAGRGPYAVALVELQEGVRMLTNVITPDPYSVLVGDAVAVAWEPLTDGRHLPVFVPESD